MASRASSICCFVVNPSNNASRDPCRCSRGASSVRRADSASSTRIAVRACAMTNRRDQECIQLTKYGLASYLEADASVAMSTLKSRRPVRRKASQCRLRARSLKSCSPISVSCKARLAPTRLTPESLEITDAVRALARRICRKSGNRPARCRRFSGCVCGFRGAGIAIPPCFRHQRPRSWADRRWGERMFRLGPGAWGRAECPG